MSNAKKYNIIPLIITFILLGTLFYFIKPNKLVTYIRASVGSKNIVLLYELDKNDETFSSKKTQLSKFLIQRGIPGTAYEDSNSEYYITVLPSDVNPKTELNFGFVEITPKEYYQKVYNAKQIYFTRTLKIID